MRVAVPSAMVIVGGQHQSLLGVVELSKSRMFGVFWGKCVKPLTRSRRRGQTSGSPGWDATPCMNVDGVTGNRAWSNPSQLGSAELSLFPVGKLRGLSGQPPL